MRIAVPAETQGAETRVAATPETVRKFKGLGAEVVVEAVVMPPNPCTRQPMRSA